MNKQLENILNAVSKSIEIDNGDLAAAAELVLHSVLQGLNVARCGIWMFETERDGIKCYLLIDSHNQTRHEHMVLSSQDFPRYFAALNSERAIVAHSARTHPETSEFDKPYLQPLGIHSMLDTPIRHSGKMVGIICCEHVGPERHWHDDEVVFSSIMSDLFGRAISAKERRDYEQKLIDANSNLEAEVSKRTEHLEQTIELLKHMQVKLIESEKMASLGALVAGVAHEVNTPLGISITAHSHQQKLLGQLTKKLGEDDLSFEDMEDFIQQSQYSGLLISHNLDRAANLVQNFKKTAADQQHLEAEPIILKDYATQVLATLHPLTKKAHAQINISGPEEAIVTYAGAFAQIITNLVNNSCAHAFQPARNTDEKANNCIDIGFTHKQKELWEMHYKDNGKGMPQKVIDKMYEPFFTTARSSGGSGLGMAIVYNLITQKLQGSVEMTATPNNGCEFTIVFKANHH